MSCQYSIPSTNPLRQSISAILKLGSHLQSACVRTNWDFVEHGNGVIGNKKSVGDSIERKDIANDAEKEND